MKLYLCVSDQSPTLNMAVVGFMGRSPSLHSVNRVTHPLSIRPLPISFRSDLLPFKFSSIIKVRLLSIVQIKMCLGARRIRFNNHLGINRHQILGTKISVGTSLLITCTYSLLVQQMQEQWGNQWVQQQHQQRL